MFQQGQISEKPYCIVYHYRVPAWNGLPERNVFHYHKTLRNYLWMLTDHAVTQTIDHPMSDAEIAEKTEVADYVVSERVINIDGSINHPAIYALEKQMGIEINNFTNIKTLLDGKTWDISVEPWKEL